MNNFTYKYGRYKGSLEGLCSKYKLVYADVVRFMCENDCDYKEALDNLIPKFTPYSYRKHSMTLEEWSKVTGIPTKVLFIRIERYRWSVETALTSPCTSARKVTV